MRASTKRAILAVIAFGVVVFICVATALAIEPVRSSLARSLLSAGLAMRGFELRQADVRLGGGQLAVRNLSIDDYTGARFLAAEQLLVAYSIHGVHFSLRAIDLDRAHLVVRRESDGSFNAAHLLGGGTQSRNNAQASAPIMPGLSGLKLAVAVRDSEIDFLNPSAPARPGRRLWVAGIDLSARIDGGSVSTGRLRAMLVAPGQQTVPVRASFFEDDRTKLATLHADASRVPLAPLLDLFVSSPAFIVQTGIADLRASGYALRWSDQTGPLWHVTARGFFRDGRLSVAPLVAPARDVAGPMEFMDGVLSLPRVTGDAAKMRLAAHGSITLVPAPQLDIIVATAGPLENARNLMAFSKPLPLSGHVDVQARVNGTPTDPRVAVNLLFPQGLRYAHTPLTSAQASLVYYRNHVTLPMVAGRYQGFAVYGSGDVDMTSQKIPSGQFAVSLRGPSRAIPWLANLEDRGTLSARATLSGQLAKLEGSGFVRLNGPAGSFRTTFSATHDRFTFGPLLAFNPGGGSLWLAASIDRKNQQGADAHVVAHNFTIKLNGRRTSLPGIFDKPFGMPPVSAGLDGVAAMSGDPRTPQFGVKLRERNLAIGGSAYGDLALAGLGEGGLGWLHVDGNRARIAGIPLRDANVLLGLSRTDLRIYNGTAHVAGGSVALVGDMPINGSAGRRTGSLLAMARGIQLADLQGAGLPASRGAATIIGSLGGTHTHPRISLTGIVADAKIAQLQLSGDTHLDYNGSQVVVDNSRMLLGNGSAVTASGVIRNVRNFSSLAGARLSMSGAVREGDITDLAGSNLPPSFPVTGSVDANVRVTGTVASPMVEGTLDSPVGTVRGVTYEDLAASFAAQHGAVSLGGGHILIGNSAINASGSLSAGAAQVSLSSPRVDLSDFNDFFNGADVLGGTGSMRLALASGGSPAASGSVQLSNAEIVDVPLDRVQARLSSHGGSILADIVQNGLLAHTVISTNVILPQGGTAVPDFAHAIYDVNAAAKNIDLGLLAPLLPPTAEGIRGRLNVVASAQGPARHLAGDARFNLVKGFIRKDPINDFSGHVMAENGAVRFDAFHLGIRDVNVTANGTYARNGAIAGHALVRTSNLATVARLAHLKSPLTGSASLALDAGGTLKQPRLDARFNAGNGSAFGVPYERVAVDTSYAPGAVNLRGATIQFPKRDGSITAAGTAPVAYGPQLPDPPGKPAPAEPLDLTVRASGLDIAAFNTLLGRRGTMAGHVDFEANATGSFHRPKLAGSAALHHATITSQLESVPLTGLDANLAFSNNQIRLSKLHGTLGKGWVDIKGIARLKPTSDRGGPGRLAYSGRLIAHNANLAVPKFFSGVLNADLGVQSGPPLAKLAGTLDISDAEMPFVGILALASGTPSGPPQQAVIPGVPPLRKGHSIWYAGSIYGDQPHRVEPTPKPVKRHITRSTPIALNLTATAGKNVQTTGLVNVTGAGSVHIGGTATSPTLRGRINMVRGQFGLFDTTFELERGGVGFHPSDGFLPTVDAVAVAYRPEAEITATVDGRVDNMHTTLESDPPMSENAIFSNVLHINEINNALSGGNGSSHEAVNAGSAAGSFVTSALTGPLFSALNYGLEQTLHIEQVSVGFDSNGMPSLELRKQYGQHIYAMFRQSFEVPPQQEYGVVYTVHNNFEVEFSQRQNPQGLLGQGLSIPSQRTLFAVTAKFPARHVSRPKHAPTKQP